MAFVAVIPPLILLAVLPGETFAGASRLPEEVRSSLGNASAYEIRASVAAIPYSVRVAFAKTRGGESFAMAEPGAEWQLTDVVLKPGLPRRRLETVALSQSFCMLFYELGGRGHSHHVAVFRLQPDRATRVWRAVFDRPIGDAAALLATIDEGKVEDDPKYGF